MRVSRLPVLVAAAAIALGLSACVQFPSAPATEQTQGADGGQGGSGDGAGPTIGPGGEVSDALAEELYLTYFCQRNARISDFNAALEAGDVDEVERVARETLDIVQAAHGAFSNPDLVWPADLQGPVDAFVEGLALEQVPLQAAIDAETEADLAGVDFTASLDAFGDAGNEYRAALGLPSDPLVACGL